MSEQISNLRILVAEDDGPNRILLREVCRTEGHIIDVAEDGAQAIEKLNTETFDILLVDLAMPKASGIEVAQAAIKQGVSVIVVSANSQSEVKEQLKSIGVWAFIEKPFRLFELTHKLEQLATQKMLGQTEQEPDSFFGPPKALRSELRKSVIENQTTSQPWSVVAVRLESDSLRSLNDKNLRFFASELIKLCGVEEAYQFDDLDLIGVTKNVETAWQTAFETRIETAKQIVNKQNGGASVWSVLSVSKVLGVQLVVLPSPEEIDVDLLITKTKKLLQEASLSPDCVLSALIGGPKQSSSLPPPSNNNTGNKRPS